MARQRLAGSGECGKYTVNLHRGVVQYARRKGGGLWPALVAERKPLLAALASDSSHEVLTTLASQALLAFFLGSRPSRPSLPEESGVPPVRRRTELRCGPGLHSERRQNVCPVRDSELDTYVVLCSCSAPFRSDPQVYNGPIIAGT